MPQGLLHWRERERVALIIPALNEEAAIEATLAGLAGRGLAQIIVVDNGSTDGTAVAARRAAATVVSEPRRGYGQACLAGMAALAPEITVVAFMDADGSDSPDDLDALLQPIADGHAAMTLGSRVLGERESGALTPQQQFGNRLATALMRLLHGARYTDLGPFRAIRREALAGLGMRDTNFGWTIEMQIKAHRAGLPIREVPVRYRRRRVGQSKISGTISGTVRAGTKILWTIVKYLR
jgi:glycosyltransferase involved in cell wall biosynthesis